MFSFADHWFSCSNPVFGAWYESFSEGIGSISSDLHPNPTTGNQTTKINKDIVSHDTVGRAKGCLLIRLFQGIDPVHEGSVFAVNMALKASLLAFTRVLDNLGSSGGLAWFISTYPGTSQTSWCRVMTKNTNPRFKLINKSFCLLIWLDFGQFWPKFDHIYSFSPGIRIWGQKAPIFTPRSEKTGNSNFMIKSKNLFFLRFEFILIWTWG